MNPVFTLMGNKSKMVDIILDCLPQHYTQYVELFGGTLSVLTALPDYKLPVIINDYNPNFVAFYKLIKNDPEYIIDSIDYWYKLLATKNLKKKKKILDTMHQEYKDGDVSVLPLLTRYTFYSRINHDKLSYRINHTLKIATINNIKLNIINLHNKLKKGKIFNYDLTNKNNIKKLMNYIKPKSFVFLDPPYISSSNNMYLKQDTGNGFINLIKQLHSKHVYFMVINKYSDETIESYNQLNKIIPKLYYQKIIKNKSYSEIIITNYTC